jgi:hypothetical protein
MDETIDGDLLDAAQAAAESYSALLPKPRGC